MVYLLSSPFFPFRAQTIRNNILVAIRLSSIVTSSTFIVDSLIFYFLAYYSPHNLFYLYNIVQLILCSLSHSTSTFSFAKNFSSYLQFTIIAFTNIIIHISLSQELNSFREIRSGSIVNKYSGAIFVSQRLN